MTLLGVGTMEAFMQKGGLQNSPKKIWADR